MSNPMNGLSLTINIVQLASHVKARKRHIIQFTPTICIRVKVFLMYGKFECQNDIHFKTQLGQVAKITTPRPPAEN